MIIIFKWKYYNKIFHFFPPFLNFGEILLKKMIP
jgi:hypothetical protein